MSPSTRFGPYGGRYVPETLIAALDELEAAYAEAVEDPAFQAELSGLLCMAIAGGAVAQTTISAPRALNDNAIPDIGSNDDVFPHVATDRKGTWIAVWHAVQRMNE